MEACYKVGFQPMVDRVTVMTHLNDRVRIKRTERPQ